MVEGGKYSNSFVMDAPANVLKVFSTNHAKTTSFLTRRATKTNSRLVLKRRWFPNVEKGHL